MKRQYNLEDEFIDKIISVAYGDANIFERFQIYWASLNDVRVRRLLNEYKETAEIVNSFDASECPEELLEKVNSQIGVKTKSSGTVRGNIESIFLYRPLISASAAVILISLVASVLLFRQPKIQKKYSTAQIELAERQVKESLAMVSRVFDKAENRVTNKILIKQVAPPINESLSIINNLFNGG